MAKRRGADALAAALVAAGARRIFTLSGNHVMPLFDATIDAGIELVHVRHEAAAVHMADAWARITGGVGVALVTGGPGHANAVGALYTAAMAESPVVLLSGHAPLAEIGRAAFQEMRQVEIAAPLCKASGASSKASEVGRDFTKAAIIAAAGRPGPVHLSLPTDVLEAESGEPEGAALEPPRLPAVDPRPIADFLAGAERPLVVCGPRCGTRAGRDRMAALESASGVPVIAMESPRGVKDPSLGELAAILGRADRVLLLGKRLDFTLGFGKALAADAEVMQVDPDRGELERTARALGSRIKGVATSDTFETMEALTRAAVRPASTQWLDEARMAMARRPSGWTERATVRMLRPAQAVLARHPDAVFVSDGGEFGQWAQACLDAPHRVINGVAGAIGAALPFAVAAALAKPGAPVIAALGDGTFGFHPAEIDTAVRCRAPFVAIVGNDARWNAEYQIQLRDYGRERAVGCELLPTRYDRVAEAFGGHGEHVDRPESMAEALERALASGKPAVVDVTIEGAPAPKL